MRPGPAASPEQHAQPSDPPTRMTRYLWLVLISAFLAWMFDSIALNVFNLILTPSMSELLHTTQRAPIAAAGGLVVAIKLVAWGIGGTLFGVLTDRYGRARIMLITIVIYCLFTGLSALAQSWQELAACQALAGLGIGGEWSAGAALLAESLPERLRPKLMIVMQLAYSVGYFSAAVVNLVVGAASWRSVLVWCAAPAIGVIILRLFVKEPEAWVRTQRHTSMMGSLRRLFEPRLRRRTLAGLFSAMSLMVGSFAATTFAPSWIVELASASGSVAPAKSASYVAMLLNGGAIVGYLALVWLVQAIGRRGSYFVFCLGSLLTAVAMFTLTRTAGALLLAAPVAGFFMLGGFGVFAVYLPELFPTEVRATGQGFCFNFARIITGFGTVATGMLVGALGSYPMAGLLVSLAFIVGLFAIWLGPETRGWRLSDT